MKRSTGFNARRLRSRGHCRWCWRMAMAISALLACLGILLSMAGTANLLGHPAALELPGSGLSQLGGGLVSLWLGVFAWRVCRAKQRRRSQLSLAPHLMKKSN